VFHVHRVDGPDWIARVFAAPRERADVEGDAHILRALEHGGFPAERCAVPAPVTSMTVPDIGTEDIKAADGTVLVTEFVEGERSRPNGSTYAWLGGLLGRLHSRPATDFRPGGAWHHLVPRGTPADEVHAAQLILERARPARASAPYDRLLARVEATDPAIDLPHALVHPDFVPANAITTEDARPVIIDWANAGRGPRLWSLGFLLLAAGARDLRLVDAVGSRYRRHCRLEVAEFDRLSGAIRARALMIDCWSLAAGRLTVAEVARRSDADVELSERIAERARAVLSADD
jgi:Ser/Thr protein kinase RdoA (MazF antagonist)